MAERGEIVVEARHLIKDYGAGEACVHALRDVSLAVERATLLAIMGRSGSGKSTLLHILGGIEVPSGGQILLEGVDLATLDDDQRTLMRRRRIGFVFQSFNLLPTFSAEENVSLPLLLDNVSTAEASRRARDALDLVEMGHRLTHVPSSLSGGEQQRVAIARALVTRPAIVLADEPTGNLDSVSGRRVMDLLHKLVDEQGQTLIMVTHDESIGAEADRLVMMSDGAVEQPEQARAI